jgi:predicted AAA+ superfamily ATPase
MGAGLGALFESLVAHSVRVYAAAADATVGHLRAHDSAHEVDLIVEATDRRIVAIEVKLSSGATDHDVRHLTWLAAQLGDRVVDRVLINAGTFATRGTDGVAVVPLALLGP